MYSWYCVQQLVGLPGLPGTQQGVRKMAARAGWEKRRRLGSKALEYALSSLPEAARAALLARTLAASDGPEPARALPDREPAAEASRLSEAQRKVMLARLAFVREIERMSQAVTQQRAIMTLVALARSGGLSPYLKARATLANDRASETRTLSERTLKRWLADFRRGGETALAPVRRQPDMRVPDWAPAFLRCFQRPTKPSVEASYAEFAQRYAGARPSIHQVRRFLGKLAPDAREQGRHGRQELKALQAFKRRRTSTLRPGDVYTADGHKFDAEVINPRTGKPYRPEITTVLDVATRRLLGVSVGEAESAIGVLDALRDAVTRGGMFAVFYVDNGSGFANDSVRETVDRLGGTMTHSLPYNSQARGLSERGHRTIWVRAAKRLTSYIGADMDAHAGTRVHRIGRRQLRDSGSTRLMPTFAEFMAGMEHEIAAYNAAPHRGLGKIRDPHTGALRHQSPLEAWAAAEADGWQALRAPAALLEDLMRPQVVRKTLRGEVQWAGQRYFLADLTALHGQEIRLAYDVRDAGRVWIRTLDGRFVGEAQLDGNASDYMPKSLLERAYEKREQGQVRRAVDKLETLTGKRVLTCAADTGLPLGQLEAARRYAETRIEDEAPFQVPGDDVARYRLWMALDASARAGESLSEAQRRWWQGYAGHPDLAAMKRVFHDPGEQARALDDEPLGSGRQGEVQ